MSQIRTIAAKLRDIGLNRASVARLAEAGDDLRSPLRPTREALYSDDPVAIAMRLLFCRMSVSHEEVRDALGADFVGELISEDILRAEEDGVVAPLHLRIVRGLFLFSDYLGFDERPDAVMGAGETTAVLYEASRPRGSVASALDLGCGAGTLALLLAADCARVMGTDINPRATQLSKLNARVNGIGNAEFRTGSLWEPVAGLTFDLIVSQPPYYPRGQTANELTFLHGGVRGDELPRGVVNHVAEHLSSSGRALVFTSWPEDRTERIAPTMQVLELTANRRELFGAQQCIDVIEHPGAAGPWFIRTEVSAECWGNVRPGHVDRLIENGNTVFSAKDGIVLRLAPGLRIEEEGGRPILRGDSGALLSVQPLTSHELGLIAKIEADERLPVYEVRELLTRGWVMVRHG